MGNVEFEDVVKVLENKVKLEIGVKELLDEIKAEKEAPDELVSIDPDYIIDRLEGILNKV